MSTNNIVEQNSEELTTTEEEDFTKLSTLTRTRKELLLSDSEVQTF